MRLAGGLAFGAVTRGSQLWTVFRVIEQRAISCSGRGDPRARRLPYPLCYYHSSRSSLPFKQSLRIMKTLPLSLEQGGRHEPFGSKIK